MNPDSNINRTLSEIISDGVVLAVRLGAGAPVVEACRAAFKGGLRVLEVTLTTPGALEALAVMAQEAGIVTGAGTVLTVEDVRAVARAGGRFVMSPVFDPAVVDEAHKLDLLAIPGTASPTEILSAYRQGARLVKVFPSGALGGPAYLRALRGPLPDVPLIPTSGPTAETLAEYLAAGANAVGIGAEVFPPACTLQSIAAAAWRVRQAMTAARLAGEAK